MHDGRRGSRRELGCGARALRESACGTAWGDAALGSLLLHGRFIRSHLEYGSGVRGNHYLTNVVGLLVLSGVFAGSEEGQGWARWAVAQLGREIRHQVRLDGCVHEASTSYHRLVTELFIVGADAADTLMPGSLEPAVRQGIDRMLAFAADYMRADGFAPQIGDADDGRLLPLGDYACADQRSHLHLFHEPPEKDVLAVPEDLVEVFSSAGWEGDEVRGVPCSNPGVDFGCCAVIT